MRAGNVASSRSVGHGRRSPLALLGSIMLWLSAAAMLASCGGSSSSSHSAGVQGPSEVHAQPVSTAGANPSTAAVGSDPSGLKPPAAAASSSGGPTTYSGDLPGLYGGTRNHATCDA